MLLVRRTNALLEAGPLTASVCEWKYVQLFKSNGICTVCVACRSSSTFLSLSVWAATRLNTLPWDALPSSFGPLGANGCSISEAKAIT